MDKVQNFLPQMASANNQLRREMDSKPGQEFDIENIDPSMEKIIEMVNIFLFLINSLAWSITFMFMIYSKKKNFFFFSV